MKTKHTPTPWEIIPNYKYGCTGLMNRAGKWVADFGKAEDAEKVRRAVNSHEVLLFCAKDYLAMLKMQGNTGSTVYKLINDTIAQAEGELK